MLSFISEENYEIHRGYLRSIKLKYSILEKSIDGVKDKNIEEIIGQKMKRADKSDVLELLSEIVLHEVFFSSFCENTFLSSAPVSLSYGSEAAFLNAVFRECMNTPIGFVCMYNDGAGVRFVRSADRNVFFRSGTPRLAVDVSEHAYFLDYGFDKERYLRSALPHLDLTKLS